MLSFIILLSLSVSCFCFFLFLIPFFFTSSLILFLCSFLIFNFVFPLSCFLLCSDTHVYLIKSYRHLTLLWCVIHLCVLMCCSYSSPVVCSDKCQIYINKRIVRNSFCHIWYNIWKVPITKRSFGKEKNKNLSVLNYYCTWYQTVNATTKNSGLYYKNNPFRTFLQQSRSSVCNLQSSNNNLLEWRSLLPLRLSDAFIECACKQLIYCTVWLEFIPFSYTASAFSLCPL